MLLALLLLAHAWLRRRAEGGTLLRLLPATAKERLPWLLRGTGAEALALFPIGFQVGWGPPTLFSCRLSSLVGATRRPAARTPGASRRLRNTLRLHPPARLRAAHARAARVA